MKYAASTIHWASYIDDTLLARKVKQETDLAQIST